MRTLTGLDLAAIFDYIVVGRSRGAQQLNWVEAYWRLHAAPNLAKSTGDFYKLTARGPIAAPWNTPTVPIPSSQILENCVNAAKSWIPVDGRSRTRTRLSLGQA